MNDMNSNSTIYTVGIKIWNETYAHLDYNPVHMTIAYLGVATMDTLQEIENRLAMINQLRPIALKIGEPELFGTIQHPIPVMRLQIEDPTIEALFTQIYVQFAVSGKAHNTKPEIPKWHVATKNSQLQEEFLKKKGSIVIGGTLYIKPLGQAKAVVAFD